ncbi:MAG TPA: contractile injection system protein, VgrG/Pvc8 family [Allosphingosinicella sp.]|nr:contractile injection system protein, VgrG/Pvc8 family [Allosphingosinicella sp.]
MKLAALEKSHGDFHVPSFAVEIGGKDLVRDLFLAVTRIEVDLKSAAAGRFSFSVASAFDWEDRDFVARSGQQRVDLLDLFAFGGKVEVRLGYGDAARLAPMLTGFITEVSTSFAEGGSPELTVSGYDVLYALGANSPSRPPWENMADSGAVEAVAGEYNLSVRAEPTVPVRDSVGPFDESDLAFIRRLAGRNGRTFYVRGSTLHFCRRHNDKSDVVELAWGEGLSSFSPSANLGRQVGEVQVHGWSAEKGEAFVGRARRGEESGHEPSRQSGGERIASALTKAAGKAPMLSIPAAAVRDQAEADAIAKGLLEERAQGFVTGRAQCVGLPAIMPDVNVKLSGLGRAFSKVYYVTGAVHTVNGSGYRTSFDVEETVL